MNKLKINTISYPSDPSGPSGSSGSSYDHLPSEILSPRVKTLRITYIYGLTVDDIIYLKYLLEKHGTITSFKTIGDTALSFVVLVEFSRSAVIDKFINSETRTLFSKFPQIHIGCFN